MFVLRYLGNLKYVSRYSWTFVFLHIYKSFDSFLDITIFAQNSIYNRRQIANTYFITLPSVNKIVIASYMYMDSYMQFIFTLDRVESLFTRHSQSVITHVPLALMRFHINWLDEMRSNYKFGRDQSCVKFIQPVPALEPDCLIYVCFNTAIKSFVNIALWC